MAPPNRELWTLVAVCNRCGGKTVIFTHVPERMSRIQGTYSVACAQCNYHGRFPIDRERADRVEMSEVSRERIA